MSDTFPIDPAHQLEDAKAEIKRLTHVASLANTFFEDVLPQIGGLSLQRYDLMNELGMELTKLMREKKI